MLGVGGLYLLWEKTREKSLQRMVADYTSEASGYADDLRKTAVKGFKATAEAGRDIRGSVQDAASRFTENGRNAAQQFSSAATQTAERVREAYQDARSSVGDGVEQIADTAHQLRKDAEAGYRKAREFAKEEPALAIAGGVALAIGAVLLVKSSRR
jgi:gas vesicle protein